MERNLRKAAALELADNIERNEWLRARNKQLMQTIIKHLDNAADALDKGNKLESKAECDKAVRGRRTHRKNHLEIRRLYNRNAYLRRRWKLE